MSAPGLKVGDVVSITVRARYSNGISFYYGVVDSVDNEELVVVREEGAMSAWDLTQVDGHHLEIRVIAPEEVEKNKMLRNHLGSAYRSEGSTA